MGEEKKSGNKVEVEVEILGEEYMIRGDEPADYIINISSFVNEHMYKIKDKSNSISKNRVLVLGAMNLADKLYKIERKYEKFEEENNKLKDDYERLLSKFNNLKDEHKKLEEEYNEFLELVDRGALG